MYALFASTGACAMWARGMLLVRHVCSVMRHIGLVPVPPVNAPMGQRVYKVRACVVLTNLDNQVVPCGDPVSGCPACVAVVSPQVCRPVDRCAARTTIKHQRLRDSATETAPRGATAIGDMPCDGLATASARGGAGDPASPVRGVAALAAGARAAA